MERGLPFARLDGLIAASRRGTVLASVDLMVPACVSRGTPFVVTIEVRRARPGQSVTMLLEQRRGARPFGPAQSAVGLVSEGGVACASFKIVLTALGNAVLLATAYDRCGTYFVPDGASVDVI
jgi:hypothetical protein